MRLFVILLSLFFLNTGLTSPTFRKEQMAYTRVREAYSEKEKIVVKNLNEHSITRDSLRIYLRAFKSEKMIEIWGKNNSDSIYKLIREIPICEISGSVGPKRRSRDMQVPEGFYRISELNPYSQY
jgi:murein L,D-transpeptidase YafK